MVNIMKYDYYCQIAKYTIYGTVKQCIKYNMNLLGNRIQTFCLFRVFKEAHKSQFNTWYDLQTYRTELVLLEASCQSGLPGFEGQSLHASTACCNSARLVGWLALASMVHVTSDHMFSIGFISGDTASYSMCSIPSVSMKLTTVRAL